MQPLEAGEPTAIGPYRLLGRLGSGGMGRVYLGRSAGGRTVAVKVVHPHFALDEEFRARFRREVDAARRVGGAWTAPVLDADPEASVPWVATGYVAGPSLAQAVKERALPDHSVRVLGAGLAEALSAVHALGLVHRDVKPSNVLLTVDGPRLIDFGIARATDGTASLTSTGVSIGSPGYMAPEQILGKGVTGAADVFSLGAVLVYAACGTSPFPGDSSAALLYKVVHEEPELGLARGELRDVAAACLAKDPAARPTPDEVARALAPQGAARAVAAGWLPGALVEQVGRGAVALLDLEGAAPTGEAERSGPVGFSEPSVDWPSGAGAGAGVGAPAGVFGPPDPAFGSADSAYGPAAAQTPAPAQTPVAGQAPVPAPRTEVPGAGKVSVSVAATSVPGAGGRGRRISCTVALGVAGALAAVTVGSAFLLDLLPGSSKGGGDTAGGRPPSATASALPSAGAEPSPVTTPSSGTTPVKGAVPASYIGTWEGPATGLDGKLPMGTFRVTVEQGATGEEFGTFHQTDPIGAVCEDVLVLRKVEKDRIVATGIAEKSNGGQCTTGRHEVRLILSRSGDRLTYETDNPRAGDPVATMRRTDSSS
ncbi:serine/threonine protein kinase [Streptomyces antnestii]|uniref:Serine/threonine protein kinase n=1 Tax=Streptomyces antnestii TaxID=2494256 RepID=A0A437P2J9_9ACTN|nr:serine/threonine-protein kinase [Streptomyces sp. San01]RVU16514.1 serine/threonine protein kinase [Streptomyces sp. San01]